MDLYLALCEEIKPHIKNYHEHWIMHDIILAEKYEAFWISNDIMSYMLQNIIPSYDYVLSFALLNKYKLSCDVIIMNSNLLIAYFANINHISLKYSAGLGRRLLARSFALA